MRHKLLTQRTFFVLESMHAESVYIIYMQATLPKKMECPNSVPGPQIYYQENGVHDSLREDIRRPFFMQSNALSGNKWVIH